MLSLAVIAPPPAVAVSRNFAKANPAAASSLATPVDIVIAVDESASITTAEIALEQLATRLTALAEFSAQSKIGVLGFGGANEHYNAVTNHQVAVDPVCPMTEVDTPARRQSLYACIGNLRKRTPREGNHTDFLAAISRGVADLAGAGDPGRPRLLFLLTDGRLELRDAPGFPGIKRDAVNAVANQRLVTSTLPAARAAGVRIWPLGFGSDKQVDVRELREMAAGGAQDSCDPALPDATPHAIRVASAADIVTALGQIFASARCGHRSAGTSATIRPGGSADLYVTVPDVVTSGAIEVTRQSPLITVTYFDPDNRRVPVPEGSLAGQGFSLAGTNGTVESLVIDNPLPGRWRVHVAAPSRAVAGGPVTASVVWQGVLHSDIVTDPADPAPGQPVTVTVKLQVRTRPLSASDLAGVHVSVRVTGPGLAAPISVAVNDAGVRPDQAAHDGVYRGTFSVPRSATGTLTAEGIVSAQGVRGDARSASITINRSGLSVTGRMTLPSGDVAQGGQVTGTVQLSNPTGRPLVIRLVPVDTPAGVTITPPSISLPAAPGTTLHQFAVHFARSVPTGAVTGHVNAGDQATGSVYAQAAITSNVVVPPKGHRDAWLLWGLITVNALIAGLAAVTLWLLLRPGGRRPARKSANRRR